MIASDLTCRARPPAGLSQRVQNGLTKIGQAARLGEEIWIMRADVAARSARSADEVVEHEEISSEIWTLYESRDEGFGREQLERRFAHGLRLFSLRAPELVATTWIVPEGERYLDEVGLSIALEADEVWLRDVYVRPEFRGRGIFARILDAVLRSQFPARRRIVSDLDPQNRASLHAHRAYGFREHESLWALKILGSYLLRRYAGTPGGSSYLAGQDLISMNADFLKHQALHTA